ncbi:MAG: hypothetical protein U1F83_11760 [Verrucomicrobiota bacterium]
MTESKAASRNPWMWVPSLYLAQGLPFAVVNSVSVIMYKSLGVSNADIAFYTAWLYLPWVIKPLWSPVVDILRTRRWWIWTMQLLLGAGFAPWGSRCRCQSFSLPLALFLPGGVQFRDARHRGGRLHLLATTREEQGGLCWHPQHVLSHLDDFQARTAGDPGGADSKQHRFCQSNGLRSKQNQQRSWFNHSTLHNSKWERHGRANCAWWLNRRRFRLLHSRERNRNHWVGFDGKKQQHRERLLSNSTTNARGAPSLFSE